MAELFVPKIIDELGDVVVKQLGEKINLVMGVEKERIITTSFIDESEVYGRDSDKVALLDQVLSKSSSQGRKGVQVISVVGAGGSGKTTLAQLLFNNDKVKNHFELRNWICVSDPFDQKRIAKAILENAGKSSQESELDPLIQRIKETFSGKRFLLVLDDVWTEDDSKWEPFQNSLKDGAPGSVILVTTRSHRVAAVVGTTHTHQMALMSDSDCWLIMQRIAFANKSGDLCKKVERIGQKIAEKCKGLPLAAKTMGSLLRLKDTVQQWQNVLDTGERLELVGREYFNNLAMRSFFQELEKVEAYYGLTEYMHNNPFVALPEAICDLYYLETLNITFCKKLSCLPERIEGLVHLRHLFNEDTDDLRQIPQGLRKLTSLCTLGRFIARSNSDDLAILKDLNQLKRLIIEIEGEVDFGSAKLGKKINMREIMEPPPNLEQLTLIGYLGAQLPSWLVTKSHTNNLTRLIISGPRNISSLHALWKLSSLEELKLGEAEKLECLGKEFFGSSFSAEAVAFPNLRKLHFRDFENWTNWEDLSEDEEEVAVSIMPRLEELKISHCYELETLPHRILSKISSLKKLDIRSCDKLRDRYSDKTGDDWIKISHISQVHISNEY
ncbi:unnamed protein product [Coffea canephora]|uniref:DH200=94 genomic scaffold, scaffold_330 n=1 Tax=Coffea canephora TaxID=49390 RepID=A0A068VEM6_COFCA|nr:unnamed protein product [Coffea canephora]